jgi:hypothetical protein
MKQGATGKVSKRESEALTSCQTHKRSRASNAVIPILLENTDKLVFTKKLQER